MNLFNIENKECIEFVEQFHSKSIFKQAIKEHYSHVVGYHTTKLNEFELNSIKSDGLKTGNISLYLEKAISRFIHPSDNDELRSDILDDINHALNNKSYYRCDNQINFGLIKDFLIEDCYQYLLFGSESLICLALDLRKKYGINFRSRMIHSGKPTIITAYIPLNKIDDFWLENMYGYLLENDFEVSVVYQFNLPSNLIAQIEHLPEPHDKYLFEYN